MNAAAVHVIGAGGHGKVTAEIFLLEGRKIRVLDGSDSRQGGRLLDHVIESEDAVLEALAEPVDFFVAIGDSRGREVVMERWRDRGHRPLRAIHPSATVSPWADLDDGVCVMAGAIVQTGCRVCCGAIVNTGATIDHDGLVGPFAHLAPGCHLAGDVHVGEHAWVGVGSAVREGLRIGAGTMVGAGSVVVTDVPVGVVALGNPCRVVETPPAGPDGGLERCSFVSG